MNAMFGILIWDNYWWLFIPGLLLGLFAQWRVSSTYSHYLEVPVDSGLTGAQAARRMLDSSGLSSVAVEEVQGRLTDHYDPTKRALFLSSDNYHGRSLSAVGVSAHEAGHALQHKAAYAPLNIRMMLVPITGIATQAAMWITFLGMFLHMFRALVPFAIMAFGIITLFQVVTLPVEFDASRRAKQQLFQLGMIGSEERSGVSKVLNAAALTYVAAMVASALDLLHFILIARGQRDDRD